MSLFYWLFIIIKRKNISSTLFRCYFLFNIILFINSKIDKGTYTKDGESYLMDGFEYSMETIGRKDGDTFAIDFYIPAPAGDELFCTLYFEKN